ncbi:MAG: twin-arginine translocase TatA/TatE family subunit [Acidobacteria bacterium]|nr:twin-arginine translocase TatA/TatE family subunit [Acidobacteriota bacterium]
MLGTGEVILILVIALIVFGPRQLPQLGKSLGQAMAQFRRASDDFKRTWEQEVETEKIRKNDSDNSSYNYDSTASNDPYNPYSNDAYSSDQATDQNAMNSSSSSQGQDQTNDGADSAQVETSTASSAKPPEKHWI